jgi:peptide/nickel transport system permease protein
MKTIKQLLTNPISLSGLIILLGFVVIAVAAPVIAPPPPNARDPYQIPQDGFAPQPKLPSPEHPLGTTEGQFDLFYGIVWGTRTAFRVGIVITACCLLIGLTIGSLSSYYGGWLDEVLQRIVEIFMAFPFLLAALTLTSILQTVYGRGAGQFLLIPAKALALIAFFKPWTEKLDPSAVRLLTGMMALIAFSWMNYARLIRGDILAVKERDFVLAARSIGVRDWRILTRHVIPNAIFPTLVYASMDIGSYVLNFAALSFLGVGAPKGYADWGQIISFARNWIPQLSLYWHIIVYPGAAIVLFVLSWNLIGDAFRDILDPRLHGSRG